MVSRKGRPPRKRRDWRWRLVARLQSGWCEPCAKWSYGTAKSAGRAALIAHPGEADLLDVYPCPAGRGHHYGHPQHRGATG